MRTMRMLAGLFVVGALLAPAGSAQEKAKPAEEAKPITSLKVQVVLSEFDGEKKVSSLPYAFFVNADERAGRLETSVRMGLRVPVTVSTKESASSVQFVDVGTNVDCYARAAEQGRFSLGLTVERSSLYAAGSEKKSLDWSPGDAPLGTQPIIRQFKVSLRLLLHDGQTVQGTMATDPVSGRVLKLDVTLNVVK